MKRVFSFFTMVLLALSLQAQVAQWLIPPVYDKVERPVGANIIVTDSLNSKTLWTTTGIRLDTTTDDMYPYSEGYIVTTQEDTPNITTIYDGNGSSTSIDDGYQLGWGYPYFHDGHLLVFDGKYFQYMNGEGEVAQQKYVTAYPFHGGYASCYTYENLRKMKDPYFSLIDKDMNTFTFTLDGKSVGRNEVEFVSSVNDEGLAVVVIKRKLYYFDTATKELRPVYAPNEEATSKNQAKLEGSMADCYVSTADSSRLKAKCGKAGNIEISFDYVLAPTALTHNGIRHNYKAKEIPQHNLSAKMKKMMGANNLIGLYWDGKEMLPPQFSKVPLLFEDKAIVLVDRKYGMLQMHPDENFVIRLNKGEPIGFRHKRFDTTIRVDMPPYVSAAATVIELSPETGCRIDKISRDTKETRYGNYTQYECELDIPEGLTEEVTSFNYPAYVVYQGLQSTPLSAEATAWHSKYYNVDINDNDYSISGGDLALTFNVNAVRLPGETVYPYDASIRAEGLNAEILERVSETRYKCKVHNLREGTNTIIVDILEDGCPPASYTFEVGYSRPKASSGGKQKVTIVKKPAKQVRHLDI